MKRLSETSRGPKIQVGPNDRPGQTAAANRLLGPPLGAKPLLRGVRCGPGARYVCHPPDAGLAGGMDEALGADGVDLEERLVARWRFHR